MVQKKKLEVEEGKPVVDAAAIPEEKKESEEIEVVSSYIKPEDVDMTDVYDEADIASALEMEFIAQALANHKAKVAPETHPDFDGETCVECGNDMPPQRLALGRIRCVECQTKLEKKSKLFGNYGA